MAEWKECTLGDVLSLKRGYDLPKSQMRDGNIPVAGSNGIIGFHDEFTPITPCITIGRSGNIGNVYYYDRCWAHNTTLYVDDYKGNNPKYLYYFLKTLPIASYAGGSAVPTLNRNHIYPIKVCFCSNVEKQKEIADILSSLDDKIEVNRKINENLEQQAEALFKSWFVDFEPFKDGKFIDSELGKIPEGWRVGSLLDVANLYDKKRIPLSNAQRVNMNKKYPYYGATSLMDFVEDYLFDGIYLLMGEDGSVADEYGFPYLQYVWGKFWVNNHAHIMQGKNGFSTEMLYCLLSKTNIMGLITGAVQAKITQVNMKKILLPIAPLNVLNDFNSLIKPLFENYRIYQDTCKNLSYLRDALLPKLMSDEIKL